MNALVPELCSDGQVLGRVNGCLGVISLNRPEALHALTLPMVRDIATLMRHWETHPDVEAVLLTSEPRDGRTPAFCAGGDIRFFHRAALAGDAALHAFFTAEYALNHCIHGYAKPCIALMDGVVMGGGMGLAQGARLRVVNGRSRLAMPETRIGLFPDVGGGWFLGRCPGRTGEWLALTGQSLGAGDAIELGLADVFVPDAAWEGMVQALRDGPQPHAEHVIATVMGRAELAPATEHLKAYGAIDRHFGQSDLQGVMASLAADPGCDWSRHCLSQMEGHSPLMMAVSLELVRRGRRLSLADDLRLELGMVWRCFEGVAEGLHSEAMEGIRARAIDKHSPAQWRPASPADVRPEAIERILQSPWPAASHPLAHLA